MLLVVVIAALAGAVGYFTFIKKSELIAQQPLPTITNETSNWKTYKNDQYGFELKYPSTWIIDVSGVSMGRIYFVSPEREISNRNVSETSVDLYIQYYSKLDDFGAANLDELFKKFVVESKDKTAKLQVSYPDMLEVSGEKAVGVGTMAYVGNYSIYTLHNDHAYAIIFGGPKLTEIGKQILSTFKFTPSATTNIYPSWIKELIAEQESGQAANPPASLTQFEYKNQTVYYLPSRCCDIPSVLYDKNGNVICSPDGGLAGRGDGKCSDFFQIRQNGKVIWKDTR